MRFDDAGLRTARTVEANVTPVEDHNIPLRRIVTPYGYGEAQPVADNTTREGREQNRRVEVKVLVSRGLTQSAPVAASGGATSDTRQ